MNTSIRTYQNIPFLGAMCFPCSLTYISCFSFSNNFLFLVAVCNFPWCWCWCAIIDPIFSYNWQFISDSSNFKNVWAHHLFKHFFRSEVRGSCFRFQLLSFWLSILVNENILPVHTCNIWIFQHWLCNYALAFTQFDNNNIHSGAQNLLCLILVGCFWSWSK